MRFLFLFVGAVMFFFGVLGILAPIIPSVPFLLLAAYCFARGSERFHDWLINHRFFGSMIKHYQRRGTPPLVKVATIAGLTVSVAISYFIFDATTPRIILIAVWALVVFLTILLPYHPEEDL